MKRHSLELEQDWSILKCYYLWKTWKTRRRSSKTSDIWITNENWFVVILFYL